MRTLEGLSIGLSISDAPDRARLGLPLREVDRTLFTICTVLVRAGARIVYAGNLEPTGFTFSIFRHLAGAYATGARAPFVHLVPEPVLRSASFDGLGYVLIISMVMTNKNVLTRRHLRHSRMAQRIHLKYATLWNDSRTIASSPDVTGVRFRR